LPCKLLMELRDRIYTISRDTTCGHIAESSVVPGRLARYLAHRS
jgi:hypothetical protein